jgi:hypothetical protein
MKYVIFSINLKIVNWAPEYFQGLWGDRNTANFDGTAGTNSKLK